MLKVSGVPDPVTEVKSFLKNEQDRQCTHNVTLRRVRKTIVAVEKQ